MSNATEIALIKASVEAMKGADEGSAETIAHFLVRVGEWRESVSTSPSRAPSEVRSYIDMVRAIFRDDDSAAEKSALDFGAALGRRISKAMRSARGGAS